MGLWSAIISAALAGMALALPASPSAVTEMPSAADQDMVASLFRRDAAAAAGSDDCLDLDRGVPGNMHWNDPDQFVVVNRHRCRPKLGLRDGSCRHHQDLSTKCAAFCQTSAFHFYMTPIPLMGGKICRAGEGCELRQEDSHHVEVSNTEVMRHVVDATASVSPSANLGFGWDFKNYNLNTWRKRSTTLAPEDDMIAAVMAAMEEQDHEMELLYGRPTNGTSSPALQTRGEPAPAEESDPSAPAEAPADAAADAAAASMESAAARPDNGTSDAINLLSIPIPYPKITSPAASIAMTFSSHFTRDWTHTYHRSEDKASFMAMTHKQVPGDGCGNFWAVPIGVGYCGWAVSPRFPPAVHDDAMKWLNTAANPYDGPLRMGRWGDTTQQQWSLTPGRCPVNYFEYPFCYAAPVVRPGVNGQEGQALHRVVWRPYDCDTAQLLPTDAQPREVRQQLNFDEFFKYHIRKDKRLFNPALVWDPSEHQDDDRYFDEYPEETEE